MEENKNLPLLRKGKNKIALEVLRGTVGVKNDIPEMSLEEKKRMLGEVEESHKLLESFKTSGRNDFAAFKKEWKAQNSPADTAPKTQK